MVSIQVNVHNDYTMNMKFVISDNKCCAKHVFVVKLYFIIQCSKLFYITGMIKYYNLFQLGICSGSDSSPPDSAAEMFENSALKEQNSMHIRPDCKPISYISDNLCQWNTNV